MGRDSSDKRRRSILILVSSCQKEGWTSEEKGANWTMGMVDAVQEIDGNGNLI
jgi:hypothetical protein